MRIQKSVKADAAGRINLGKECAGRLFTVTESKGKIVLEVARVVAERELQSQKSADRLLLTESEWSRLQDIMDGDDEPTDALRRLMKP